MNGTPSRWQLGSRDRQCPVCIRRTYAPAKQNSKLPPPLAASSSSSSMNSLAIPETTFPFLSLIPEIRIKIYELFIQEATTCISDTDIPRRVNDLNDYQFASGEPRNLVYRGRFVANRHLCDNNDIRVTVHGQSTIIENIAPLPLLFVNKQIHNEVAALVYPRFSSLYIEPSILGWTDDINGLISTNPLRWAAMREVTSLKITFGNELVKKIGESWRDLEAGCTKEDWFMPWPNIPALLQVIEDLERLERVEVEVEVLGDPALTRGSKALQGDDCFSWLFPFRDEVKRDVKSDIGFGKSGRCTQIYQRRWDELCKKRDETVDDLPSVSTLAI